MYHRLFIYQSYITWYCAQTNNYNGQILHTLTNNIASLAFMDMLWVSLWDLQNQFHTDILRTHYILNFIADVPHLQTPDHCEYLCHCSCCAREPVLLLRSDAVASPLTNGSAAFEWKLHCHLAKRLATASDCSSKTRHSALMHVSSHEKYQQDYWVHFNSYFISHGSNVILLSYMWSCTIIIHVRH